MKPKGWKDIPIGGVIVEPGNSDTYETGSWRTYKPLYNKEKCTNCLRCWIFCPDSAIIVKDGLTAELDTKENKAHPPVAKPGYSVMPPSTIRLTPLT